MMPRAIAGAVTVLVGAATDVDMMMTMAGERGGEATTRQRRGEYKATSRQKDAKAIGYGAAGGRGNEAINKRIINILIDKYYQII